MNVGGGGRGDQRPESKKGIKKGLIEHRHKNTNVPPLKNGAWGYEFNPQKSLIGAISRFQNGLGTKSSLLEGPKKARFCARDHFKTFEMAPFSDFGRLSS